MLTRTDIHNIIALGEGYYAEFKLRPPAKVREIAAEVCAFANASGGVILFGVDDQNHIRGCNIDNAKRSAIQNAIDEINPHIHCAFYKIENKHDLWVIEVPSGTQKPYALSGAIYVRQGPNTQKITSVEQMRDFFQQADRIYFDESPCNEFDPEKHFDD